MILSIELKQNIVRQKMIEKHKVEIASLLFSNEFPIRFSQQDFLVEHRIEGKSANVYEVT